VGSEVGYALKPVFSEKAVGSDVGTGVGNTEGSDVGSVNPAISTRDGADILGATNGAGTGLTTACFIPTLVCELLPKTLPATIEAVPGLFNSTSTIQREITSKAARPFNIVLGKTEGAGRLLVIGSVSQLASCSAAVSGAFV
jgi:hypothetical protein